MEEVASATFSTTLEDCDILVVGTKLGKTDLDTIERVYSQRERDLVAFGNCVISGGIFHKVAQASTLNERFEVDLLIPGCPPTFDQFKSSLCQFLGIKEQ
jgi:Ni,Fe-hydrogenase III small subunit